MPGRGGFIGNHNNKRCCEVQGAEGSLDCGSPSSQRYFLIPESAPLANVCWMLVPSAPPALGELNQAVAA